MLITRNYPLITDSTQFGAASQVGADIRAMGVFEAEEVSAFFESILTPLPYYNAAAKRGELAKYAPDRLRDMVRLDPESVLIAKADSGTVGFCFNNKDDHTIWLAWMGVHPEFRHLGIGKRLLDRLEQRAMRLSSHKIWCDSRTENSASASLLRRQGYEQTCTLKRHWYRQDFFIWEKFVG
jgi:ribosomal protein S18 acetylase RimI-like enzyme